MEQLVEVQVEEDNEARDAEDQGLATLAWSFSLGGRRFVALKPTGRRRQDEKRVPFANRTDVPSVNPDQSLSNAGQ